MKLNISRVKPFPIAGLGLAVAILTGSIQSQGQSATQEKEAAPAPYSVIDLGVVGGPPGGPYVINNYGLVSGWEDQTVQPLASTDSPRQWARPRLRIRMGKTFAASTPMGLPHPLYVSLSCGKTE
jgi:hypothetical protein